MQLLTAKQVHEWDAFTILHEPIDSVDLMERASRAFTDAFLDDVRQLSWFSKATTIHVFCGPGNNGGDGLAIARMLYHEAYRVMVYVLNNGTEPSADHVINADRLRQLEQAELFGIAAEEDFPVISQHAIIIEALYGSGLSRPLAQLSAALVEHLNRAPAYKVSVDIPAGLPADISNFDVVKTHPVFKANHTYTFEVVKQSFLFAETYEYIGERTVLPIGLHRGYLNDLDGKEHLFTGLDYSERYQARTRFSHKGTHGHALIIGGSFGKTGAMLLAGKAALRAGCGLLTAYVPRTSYTIYQGALPEAMVLTDDELLQLSTFQFEGEYKAIGVGMGMGTHPATVKAFGNWLKHVHAPLLIDADGLNACAALMKTGAGVEFPAGSVLTPHPKEFERLAGRSSNSIERFEKARDFAIQHKVILVLKGAYTCIALPDGNRYFNSSGNALLATAGSGDVLSGIITSLMAQGYEGSDAALMGVYLHGAAADRLAKRGYKTCIASDIIAELSSAL